MERKETASSSEETISRTSKGDVQPKTEARRPRTQEERRRPTTQQSVTSLRGESRKEKVSYLVQ